MNSRKNIDHWITFDNEDMFISIRIEDVQKIEMYHLNPEDISYFLHLKGKVEPGYDDPATIRIDFKTYCYLINLLKPEIISLYRKCSCGGYPVHFSDSENDVEGIACSLNPDEHRVFCKWHMQHVRFALSDAWSKHKFGNVANDKEYFDYEGSTDANQ